MDAKLWRPIPRSKCTDDTVIFLDLCHKEFVAEVSFQRICENNAEKHAQYVYTTPHWPPIHLSGAVKRSVKISNNQELSAICELVVLFH